MEKYYVKYGDFIYGVESRKVSVVKDISEVDDWRIPHDFTYEMSFENVLKCAKGLVDIINNAIHFKEKKNYEYASREFEKAANLLENIGDKKACNGLLCIRCHYEGKF